MHRSEALQLIIHLSQCMRNRIHDYDHFKNHIYSQTNGNPLFILELVSRFSKEPSITSVEIRKLKHSTANKDTDISIPLVIMISSLMLLRYMGSEFTDDRGAYRLFGGLFMIFALFGRNIFSFAKRKFV